MTKLEFIDYLKSMKDYYDETRGCSEGEYSNLVEVIEELEASLLKRKMVQIVIDISEEMYDTVMNGTYCGSLYEELKNGTLLPKGHGRLIDEYQITACEWDGEYMHCNAPTIVPADRSEE